MCIATCIYIYYVYSCVHACMKIVDCVGVSVGTSLEYPNEVRYVQIIT